jgi:Transposase DDE domain
VAEAADAVALDGKVLRGSSAIDHAGLHLLTAFAPATAVVLGQQPVPATTNEYKIALELLGVLPLKGKVVTADAMFCQSAVCQTIRDRGGDYILAVKDNQPELHATFAATFAESEGLSPLARACLG